MPVNENKVHCLEEEAFKLIMVEHGGTDYGGNIYCHGSCRGQQELLLFCMSLCLLGLLRKAGACANTPQLCMQKF